MEDRYDRDGLSGRDGTVETPSESAHKRGLITGLVVGVIGGAILGGIVVGLIETGTTSQSPVATSPTGTGVGTGAGTAPRQDRVFGTTESDMGPGRTDTDDAPPYRTREQQDRLEGPGATPGTQPLPR